MPAQAHELAHCMTPAEKIWISPIEHQPCEQVFKHRAGATKAPSPRPKAPVAPEIIPRTPPRSTRGDQTTRNAAYSPTNGFTPAGQAQKAHRFGHEGQERRSDPGQKFNCALREERNPSPGIHRRSVNSNG